MVLCDVNHHRDDAADYNWLHSLTLTRRRHGSQELQTGVPNRSSNRRPKQESQTGDPRGDPNNRHNKRRRRGPGNQIYLPWAIHLGALFWFCKQFWKNNGAHIRAHIYAQLPAQLRRHSRATWRLRTQARAYHFINWSTYVLVGPSILSTWMQQLMLIGSPPGAAGWSRPASNTVRTPQATNCSGNIHTYTHLHIYNVTYTYLLIYV